jgi:hypothetical protein
MNGKGSDRRPACIDWREVHDRWEATFGPVRGLTSTESTVDCDTLPCHLEVTSEQVQAEGREEERLLGNVGLAIRKDAKAVTTQG